MFFVLSLFLLSSQVKQGYLKTLKHHFLGMSPPQTCNKTTQVSKNDTFIAFLYKFKLLLFVFRVETTENVKTVKDAAIKPAKLCRGRAPKLLIPLGLKRGKKPLPSAKAKDTEEDQREETEREGAEQEQVFLLFIIH